MKLKSPHELSARLKSSPLPPAILLYGQEQGMIAQQTKRLFKEIVTEEGAADFDAETFYAGALDEERFVSACQGFPFLNRTKWVLLKEADRLSPSARQTLLGYLDSPSQTTFLVVQSANLEASSPLRKKFETSKTAWAIPFYPLEGRALADWIRGQLQEGGYRLDHDALQYLVVRLEGDTLAAASELEKVRLFLGDERQIGLREVMAVVGETAQYSGFGLSLATTNGQTVEALHILDRLMESGEEPLALLGMLAMRIRRIIQGQQLISQGEDPKSVTRKLKVFWKEERAFLNQCHSIRSRRLADGLLDCLEADAAMKGGGGPPGRVMSGLIMRLSGRFSGRPGAAS